MNSVSQLRHQAQQRLKPFVYGFATSSEVELTALGLWEQEVFQASPSPLVAQTPPDLTSARARYARDLVAQLGGSAAHWLQPALWQSLEAFRWDLLAEGQGLQVLGTCQDHHRVNRALAPVAQGVCEVAISGAPGPEQLERLRAALEELSQKTATRAMTVVRSVDVRTSLGSLPDGSPILGLAGTGRGVSLLRRMLDQDDSTRGVLFHEVGHKVDQALALPGTGFRSLAADTPFGKSERTADYPSPQVVGNAPEDFADCHAQLILDWDAIEKNPDRLIHARGEVGQKLAWIREHAYRMPVPPPSSQFCALLAAVDRGQAPFNSRQHFFDCVNDWLYGRPLEPALADWLDTRL